MQNNRTEVVIFHCRDQVQRRVFLPGPWYQWSNGQNQGNNTDFVSNCLKGHTVWVPGKGKGRIILGEKLKLTNIKLCWQTNLKLESNLGEKRHFWDGRKFTNENINNEQWKGSIWCSKWYYIKRIGQLFNLVKKANKDWRGQICFLKKGKLAKKKESRH